MLAYRCQGKKLIEIDRHAEHPKVRILMHEWKKVEQAADGILYRKTGRGRQLVLPSRYHRMVYKHLHEDLGHLGSDRANEMARERFYWPGMVQDIEHCIRNVCQCIKKKPPNLQTRAPAQRVKTTEPFELVSLDFVHLERSSGGYEYTLVGMNIFLWLLNISQGLLKPTHAEINQQRQLQINCSMILSSGLVFQSKFIMTKEKSLRIRCFTVWKN